MPLTSIYPREGKLEKVKQTQNHNKWNYANTRRYIVAINIRKERDIVEWIEERKPYQTLIRRYIREGMERDKAKLAEQSETQNKPL